MSRREFYVRALALHSILATAMKLEIAAAQHGMTPALRAALRDCDRTAREIRGPLDVERARRRFRARS